MRICSFNGEHGVGCGILADAGVHPILDDSGESLSIIELLKMGASGMTLARGATNNHPLNADDLEMLPAIPHPTTIYLLAANYQSHITESGAVPVNKDRITPRPFIKPNAAVIGTGEPILIPADSDTLDYEIEIATVIGTGGKMIAEDAAYDHVAGYVVFNDVSARSLKIADGRDERNGDWFFDWLLGKWCDSFAVIGPWLCTKDEVRDPNALLMQLHVNGELRQHSSAGEMIFSIPEAIAFLSRFVTLKPGDMICMGTPGGVGATTATYLVPGDRVVGCVELLGTIENMVQQG